MPEPDLVRLATPAVDITALAWGDPADPVAILVHGFPDSAWTWDRIGPALAARGWYAVAPFTRGYAPTSLAADDDYSIGSLVDDVLAVYHAVGADSAAVLIGHDWGGAIVSATSSSHPELFRRAVVIAIPPLAAIRGLIDQPHRLVSNLPLLARQLPRSWYMPVVSTPVLSDLIGHRLIALLWRLWAPRSEVAEYRAHGLTALADRRRLRAAFSYYRAVWNPLYRRTNAHAAQQRLAFAAMRNPTLYLQGADDTCGLARTGARALDYLPPGSRRVVIEKAGHFTHLERPDEVVRHITEFIDQGERA
ncbi:alpha/beta fold hydrolase [Nocardia brasiliensis]|uniref:alpha/beta fold hydrolase n=1 Tax=Nocardia brasiliensis TaxID=37326 RepID=UPI00366B3741